MINKFYIDPPWANLLEHMGLNIDDLLEQAALPANLLTSKSPALTTEEYFRVWNLLENIRGDLFALEMTQLMFEDVFIAPIFASLCCRDLSQALYRLHDFKPLLGPMRLSIDEQAKQTTVNPALLDILHELPRSLALAELIFLTSLARKGTGRRIVPVNVTVSSNLENVEAYADFFGTAPQLGEKLSISFSQEDLKRPFITSNETQLTSFTAEFNETFSYLHTEASFASQVRGALLELLPAGVATTICVARKLAVSTRTMQRRLQYENTNFRYELDQTRVGLAKYYLFQTSLPNQQIGFLLGFSDPNSFYQVFQGAVGMSPMRYRHAKQ